MLIASLIMFLLAASGGVFMAFKRTKTDENPPLPVAFFHGPLAIAAYIVLLIYLFQNDFPSWPSLAAGLFTVAALGGITLITAHLRGRKISLGLIFGHAIFALSGILVLLLTILRGVV